MSDAYGGAPPVVAQLSPSGGAPTPPAQVSPSGGAPTPAAQSSPSGAAPDVREFSPSGVKAAEAEVAPSGVAAAEVSAGSLPFTGFDALLLLAGGVVLLGVGIGMRRLARPSA